MTTTKFYTLKNSAAKDNRQKCRSMANKIFSKSEIPDLPIHPNCACELTEIPTLVLPNYIVSSPTKKMEYYDVAAKFPKDLDKDWYMSYVNEKNEGEFIVFSNEGATFYTNDGGTNFKKLLITSDQHTKLMNLPNTTDEEEFGKDSDTYKIIKDLGERWMTTEDQEERERLHSIADEARRLARKGTPLKYGQDVIMETLHANATLSRVIIDAIKQASHLNAHIVTYPWFVGMTCTEWDYKWNPDWQVPYSIFNNKAMDKEDSDGSYPKNYVAWIYFDGMIMGADKFGNINLGYVGTKMGFHKFLLSDILKLLGDDPKDTAMIEYGIALAEKEK